MKKFVLYGSLLIVIVFAVMAYNFASHATGPANLTATPTPAPWQPVHLRIPAMQVDAPVMSVGRTSSGVMDAPVSKALNSPYWTSVFWYKLGPAPGQAGNAVIAGHVDRVGGDPAIFWSLSTLRPSDRIYITTLQGQQLQYVVTRVTRYSASAPSNAVLNAVFGPSTAHHLNLITCSGVWTGHGYDERMVVFTTQVN